MSFFVDLWESVFTPGTTPALITATHASFIVLLISLSVLIYLTRSIHFVNLFVIAAVLYGTVAWFINELQKEKLKSNEEIAKEAEEEKTSTSGDIKEEKKAAAVPAATSGRQTRSATRRKA